VFAVEDVEQTWRFVVGKMMPRVSRSHRTAGVDQSQW
jgi:hypothetical protein